MMYVLPATPCNKVEPLQCTCPEEDQEQHLACSSSPFGRGNALLLLM